MKIYNKILDNIAWTSFGVISKAVLQLLQIAILVRYLPKNDFGIIAIALLIIQFSNVFVDSGFSFSLLHFKKISKDEFCSVFWTSTVISIIIYLIIYLVTPLLSDFYKTKELIYILPFLNLSILFNGLGRNYRTILQKKHNFRVLSLIDIISYSIGCIFAIVLVLNKYGLYSLVYSHLISVVLNNLLLLINGWMYYKISFHFKFKEVKKYFKIGVYSLISTILDFFSKEMDVIMLGKFLSMSDLGVYMLSKQLVTKVYAIVNSVIITVFDPMLTKYQDNVVELKNKYCDLVSNLSILNCLIYISLIIMSKQILDVVYGTHFSEYYIIFNLISLGYCFSSISSPISSLIIATGKTYLSLRWTFLRILVTVLFIYLGAQYGLTGAAFSYAILAIILLIPMWFIQIKPMIDVSFMGYIGTFVKPMTLFSVLSFASIIISPNTFLFNMLKLIFSITIFVIFILLYKRDLIYFFVKKINK